MRFLKRLFGGDKAQNDVTSDGLNDKWAAWAKSQRRGSPPKKIKSNENKAKIPLNETQAWLEKARVAYKEQLLEHIKAGWFTDFLCFDSREKQFIAKLKAYTAYVAHASTFPGKFLAAGFHDGSFHNLMLVLVRDQDGDREYQKGALTIIQQTVLSEEEIELCNAGGDPFGGAGVKS